MSSIINNIISPSKWWESIATMLNIRSASMFGLLTFVFSISCVAGWYGAQYIWDFSVRQLQQSKQTQDETQDETQDSTQDSTQYEKVD